MKNTVIAMNKSETALISEFMAAGGIGTVLSAQSNVGENRRFNAMKTLVKKGLLEVENIETLRLFGARRSTGDYHQHYTVLVRTKLVRIS